MRKTKSNHHCSKKCSVSFSHCFSYTNVHRGTSPAGPPSWAFSAHWNQSGNLDASMRWLSRPQNDGLIHLSVLEVNNMYLRKQMKTPTSTWYDTLCPFQPCAPDVVSLRAFLNDPHVLAEKHEYRWG